MTAKTPQEQALIEATVRVYEVIEAGDTNAVHGVTAKRNAAYEAYRATQAKECRPPSSAKDGSLWWLHRVQFGDQYLPARWMAEKEAWTTVQGGEPISASDIRWCGWTCHSECRFGETGAEATDEALREFWKAWKVPMPQRPDDPPSDGEYAVAYLRGALDHFRAPKLEISDGEALRIAREAAASLRYGSHNSALMLDGDRDGTDVVRAALAAIRAVIAKVGGQK